VCFGYIPIKPLNIKGKTNWQGFKGDLNEIGTFKISGYCIGNSDAEAELEIVYKKLNSKQNAKDYLKRLNDYFNPYYHFFSMLFISVVLVLYRSRVQESSS